MKFTPTIVTDIRDDPKGDLALVIAEKHAELAGWGRARRRRPPDAAFDKALIDELLRRQIRFGLNKACIQTAVEVAKRLGKTISPDSARSRIAELQRQAKGRIRWR